MHSLYGFYIIILLAVFHSQSVLIMSDYFLYGMYFYMVSVSELVSSVSLFKHTLAEYSLHAFKAETSAFPRTLMSNVCEALVV